MKKFSDIAASLVPPFQSCGMCSGGWITVKGKYRDEVDRCWCWKAHQAKVQEQIQQASRTKEK